MDIDQKQLLQDFVNNDLDAFRKVYQLYFNKLLKYGRIFSNDKMLVEDVIQELFTKLLQNKNKQILNLDTYLFKAVKQNIINKISRENRRENIRNLIVQDVEIRSYEEKFIENEDLTIKREWILTKVDSLSPRQKEIFFSANTKKLHIQNHIFSQKVIISK